MGELKTYVEKISTDFYLLRVDDKQTKYFEALWSIPEGVTYNAYLLLGDRNILFDSWKHTYANRFIECLRQIVDPRDIDYIVIHHMEQDHSGAIPKILTLNGGRAKVLGHSLARGMFESFYDMKTEFKPVRDGDTLAINGKTIRFIHTPWVHWPETIMSYIEEDSILLSGDVFGSFSTPPVIYDSDEEKVSGYLKFARKYFVTVVGHYSKHVLRAIEKLHKLGIAPQIIAPAHGLIFRSNPQLIIDYYMRLAKNVPIRGKVVVVYDSMYGSVEKGISVAINELRKKGIKPIVYSFTDIQHIDLGSILSEIIDAEALIIGASTYEGDIFPKIRYFLEVLAEKVRAGKKVLIVSSYGWGGVAGSKISEKLSKAGFKVVSRVEFRGTPREEDLAKIKEGISLLFNVSTYAGGGSKENH